MLRGLGLGRVRVGVRVRIRVRIGVRIRDLGGSSRSCCVGRCSAVPNDGDAPWHG